MAKQKYNDKSPHYFEWTTKKLKSEYAGYYEAIYGEASCYGMSDLRMLSAIEKELDERGIVIRLKPEFDIGL